jgi:hypothetical protein
VEGKPSATRLELLVGPVIAWEKRESADRLRRFQQNAAGGMCGFVTEMDRSVMKRHTHTEIHRVTTHGFRSREPGSEAVGVDIGGSP